MALPLDVVVARALAAVTAGDLSGARGLLSRALSDLDRSRLSAAATDAALLYARVLLSLDEAVEAATWAVLAQQGKLAVHGHGDERTIAATATLAAIRQRTGDNRAAARLYGTVAAQLAAHEGSDSARVLAAQADQATAEHASGDSETAVTRLNRVWDRYRAVFGAESAAGIKMLARLGVMERECGYPEQGQDHLEEAAGLCRRYLPAGHPLTRRVGELAGLPTDAPSLRPGTSSVYKPVPRPLSGPPVQAEVPPRPLPAPSVESRPAPLVDETLAYANPFAARELPHWSVPVPRTGSSGHPSDQLPVPLPAPEFPSQRRTMAIAATLVVAVMAIVAVLLVMLFRGSADPSGDAPAPPAVSAAATPPGAM